jgi:hypothetical protein
MPGELGHVVITWSSLQMKALWFYPGPTELKSAF